MSSKKLSYPSYSSRLRKSNLKYPEIDGFETFLAQHRGVQNSVEQLQVVTCFLDFLTDSGKQLASLKQKDIDDFISEQGTHYKRRTVGGIASDLRSFFRYLFFTGTLKRDFSESVHRPYVFSGERDPRYLKPWQVKQVLSAAQGDNTVIGKRNYAILVLLAIYGMRGKELASLRLDDLCWKIRKLTIRGRKCGDTLVLPLVTQAGRALADYLSVRPPSPFREVFLSILEPFHPLKRDSLGYVAQRAIARCGINVAHPGTHTFREK
jgi:site-specific recombinase XerD